MIGQEDADDGVSVSLSSLPPVIKYALTKWSQSVKVKFCHFSESSRKIWSLGIRSRVCITVCTRVRYRVWIRARVCIRIWARVWIRDRLWIRIRDSAYIRAMVWIRVRLHR